MAVPHLNAEEITPLGRLLLDLFAALFRPTVPPTPIPSPVPVPTPPTGPNPAQGHAAELADAIQRVRASAARPPLVVDARLIEAASRHAADMAARRRLGHDGSDGSNFLDRLARAGFRHSAAAENVAAGQRDAAECAGDWGRSPGHRANMLGPHDRLGVGVGRSADGTLYWCALFARAA